MNILHKWNSNSRVKTQGNYRTMLSLMATINKIFQEKHMNKYQEKFTQIPVVLNLYV